MRVSLLNYLLPLVLVALVTVTGFALQGKLHPTNLLMLSLAVVVLTALYLGRGPALMAPLLAMLSFDYFFVEPHLSLSVSDSQYIITLFGFLLVALIISDLTVRVKEQVGIVQACAMQMAVINAFNRDLAPASGVQNVLHVIVEHA